MSAFYKISLLALTATAIQMASSPPNPPIATGRDGSQNGSGSFSSYRKLKDPQSIGFVGLIRTAGHASVVAECAVIIARSATSTNNMWFAQTLHYLTPSPQCAAHVGLTRTFVVGCGLVLCGAGLRLWCYRSLGRFFTFELTISKKHRLITSGPYSIVRHPSYLGAFLMLAGFPLAYFGDGSWLRECMVTNPIPRRALDIAGSTLLVLVGSFFWKRVDAEDSVLHDNFGAEWEDWAKRTWKLLPFVY